MLVVRMSNCKLRAHCAEVRSTLSELEPRFIAVVVQGSSLIAVVVAAVSSTASALSALTRNPNYRFVSYAIPKITITSRGKSRWLPEPQSYSSDHRCWHLKQQFDHLPFFVIAVDFATSIFPVSIGIQGPVLAPFQRTAITSDEEFVQLAEVLCSCAHLHSKQQQPLPPGMEQFPRGLSVCSAAVRVAMADFKSASHVASLCEGLSVVPALISDPNVWFIGISWGGLLFGHDLSPTSRSA